MLGFYGSRNFRFPGFRASYALKDRSLSGTQGKNFFSGGIRLSPMRNIDFLLDYDRIGDEYIAGEEDQEIQSLSGALRLRAFDALRVTLSYSGENRMRVRVSYLIK